jgi:DNA-binding response OmpR family regulator
LPDRILVVDDEPDILNLTKMILAKRGYQVTVASDGEEALQKAQAEAPDLILLDLVMPGKSGLEVCRILKSEPKTKHIPVVMSTVLGREVDRTLTKEAGADGHFTKPFTGVALLTEVKRQLDAKKGSKFSKQLGLEHDKLKGKKLLLEFDPSTPYERTVRDFVLECASDREKVIVLSKIGNPVYNAVQGEEGVEILPLTSMVSQIAESEDEPMTLVYDNITDLVVSAGAQSAYGQLQNMLGFLSPERVTALFLLNPAAHDQKETYSLRGLFSNQLAYGKQGTTIIKIA